MANKRQKYAFTLVEILFAIIIVGIAMFSLIGASRSVSMASGAAADLSTAEFLITQIKELTDLLPVIDPQTGTTTFGAEEASLSSFDDVDDFNNKIFSPPISADGEVLNEFSAFSQQVIVQNVSPLNFQTPVTNHSSDFVKVTVTILLNSREISSTSWLRSRY